jgi:hypothetical protein
MASINSFFMIITSSHKRVDLKFFLHFAMFAEIFTILEFMVSFTSVLSLGEGVLDVSWLFCGGKVLQLGFLLDYSW